MDRDYIEMLYPVGARVKLIDMKNGSATLKGKIGEVLKIDGLGQLHILSECGKVLALIPNVDRFERI